MGKLPRTLVMGCLVALVVIASCGLGVFIGSSSRQAGLPFLARDTVAVAYIEGTIQGGQGGGLFGPGGAYSDQIIRWLQRAEDDASVKAVVLRVDSPGGAVTPSDEIHNQLLKLKAKKPIVASLGGLAASGGYYVSAAANEIVANATTLTGSIGVITVVPNVQGLLEKVGVQTYVFTSGPHKDETSGLRPLTEEDRKILQGIVDEAFARFVSVVGQGRNMSSEAVRRLADGRVFSGKRAQEAGLVDQIGDLPEAIRLAAELGEVRGEPRVVHYRAGGLFSRAGASLLGWLGLPAPPPFPVTGGAPFSVQYLYLVP